MPRAVLRCILISALLCVLCCVPALAATVEQTQICMPEIDVYLYQEGEDLSALEPEDVTATLGGVPLEATELGRSEQGIFYVYMLDVSGSMPNGHFDAAREAVINACDRLRPQDRLAFLYFGSDVTLLLKGGESREQVEAALSTLRNDQATTRLYDAMDTLIDLMLKVEDMRRIAVVISDGIEAGGAGMTQQELEQKLRVAGVSVSALCIDSSAEANVDNFRSFIELSGGGLYLYGPDDADAVLGSLLDRLDGGWLLKLRAPTNRASGEATPLSIDFGGVSAIELSVTPEQWTPDRDDPEILSSDYDKATGLLTVVYSEPVTGADDPAVYVLTDGSGAVLPVASVEALDAVTYLVTPAEGAIPEYGSVELSVRGPRDASMEENELDPYKDSIYFAAAPTPAPTATPTPVAEKVTVLDKGTLTVIAVVVGVVVAAALTIVVLSSKKQRVRKEKPVKEKKEKQRGEKPTATFMFTSPDKKDNGKNGGFSLVELIIVIAIMAALVGILAPQYIKYVEKSRATVCMTNIDSAEREILVEAVFAEPMTDELVETMLLTDFHCVKTESGRFDGMCPSGGVISVEDHDDGRFTLACSKHGASSKQTITDNFPSFLGVKFKNNKNEEYTLNSYFNSHTGVNDRFDSNGPNYGRQLKAALQDSLSLPDTNFDFTIVRTNNFANDVRYAVYIYDTTDGLTLGDSVPYTVYYIKKDGTPDPDLDKVTTTGSATVIQRDLDGKSTTLEDNYLSIEVDKYTSPVRPK